MKIVFVAFVLVFACFFMSNISCQRAEEAAPPAKEAEEATPPAEEVEEAAPPAEEVEEAAPPAEAVEETAPPMPGMAMKQFNVDAFVEQVDTDKDGSMSKEEWKATGLADSPFTFCDASKDDLVSAKEMADCRLPEAMDTDKDGVLLVDEMIEFDKRMASAPKRQYEATSPYVEGGETGMDFIRVLDGDGDGKVTHAEWEKNKQSTVYKDKHWPEYNKNKDEYLTVDEAPQKP